MIFIIIGIVIYFLFTGYVFMRIKKSEYLNEKSRKIHGILIWVLPFIGSWIIRDFWRKNPNKKLEIMTKSRRKIDKSNFRESGKGIFG
jgi:hypothetical protein